MAFCEICTCLLRVFYVLLFFVVVWQFQLICGEFLIHFDFDRICNVFFFELAMSNIMPLRTFWATAILQNMGAFGKYTMFGG